MGYLNKHLYTVKALIGDRYNTELKCRPIYMWQKITYM